MDPTPFISLGLKAVPVAVDKYPAVKQKAKSMKLPGRRRHRDDGRRRDDDNGYDSHPGPSRDRDGRRNTTHDGYNGGRRDKSRHRRSMDDADAPRGSYGRSRSRGARRYDAPKGTWSPCPSYPLHLTPSTLDRGYHASEAESPAPYARRNSRRKSLGPAAAAGAAGAGALALKNGSAQGPTAMTRYRSPDTYGDRTMTRYKPSTRRSKSEHYSDSDSDSSSSSSSTNISVSSTEDEKRARRLKLSLPLTAGIAAVATIHAANGLHKSVKAHDKRVIQVANGEMTKDEARTLQNKGLVQDVAKVGLGVMGIQAARAKWKEVEGGRKEYKEHKKDRRERDRKRDEKRGKERRRRREERGSRGGGERDRDGGRDKSRGGRGDRDRERDRDGGGGGGSGRGDGYRDRYHDGYRGRDRGLARRSEPDIRRYSTR
jgi:hypothetical protein